MLHHIGNKGSALVVTLVLVIVMSGMGVISVNQAVREVRISSSYDSSAKMLAYAEAAVTEARKKIFESPTPELVGFDCQGETDDEKELSTNYWPTEYDYKQRGVGAKYCITLLGSGQSESEGAASSDTGIVYRSQDYFYKIDAYVERISDNNVPIVIKHVQSIEKFSRVSN